jgi:hypothetical protein
MEISIGGESGITSFSKVALEEFRSVEEVLAGNGADNA